MMAWRKWIGLLIIGALAAIAAPAGGQDDEGIKLALHPASPVLLSGAEAGAWDAQFAFGPYAMEHNGRYYLFYTGYSGGSGPGAISIGVATSPDGINWTKSTASPFFDGSNAPAEQVSFPVVFVDKHGTWVMLFSAVSFNNGKPGGRLWRATARAPEGPWTVAAEPALLSEPTRWDARMRASGVVEAEGEYRLYYTGFDPAYSTAQMGLATSADGLTWTFYDDPATTDPLYAGSDPVLTVGTAGAWDGAALVPGSVLETEDGWLVFYTGFSIPLSQRPRRDAPFLQFGIATSRDGVQWVRAPEPAFESNQREWFHFAALRIADNYLIYFDEITPNGIGLMVSE